MGVASQGGRARDRHARTAVAGRDRDAAWRSPPATAMRHGDDPGGVVCCLALFADRHAGIAIARRDAHSGTAVAASDRGAGMAVARAAALRSDAQGNAPRILFCAGARGGAPTRPVPHRGRDNGAVCAPKVRTVKPAHPQFLPAPLTF